MSKQAKTYPDEFKREAVRMAKERGNIAQTARDLGVSDTSILYWRKQLEEASERPFPGQGNPRDPEMAPLQRQNARLKRGAETRSPIKEENDILKKRWVSSSVTAGVIIPKIAE